MFFIDEVSLFWNTSRANKLLIELMTKPIKLIQPCKSHEVQAQRTDGWIYL